MIKTALALAALAAMGSTYAQDDWLSLRSTELVTTDSDEPTGSDSDTHPTRLPFGLGARIQLVWATYNAELEYERAGKSGNQIELDDEIPLDNDGVGYDFRGWIRIGEWVTLDGRYLRLANGINTGTARNNFVHDNLGVAAGDRIETEHTLELAWAGVRIATALHGQKLRISVPVGVLYTSQRLAIRQFTPPPQGKDRGSVRLESWTPYVGGHASGVLWDGFGEAGFEAEALVGYAYLDVSAYLTFGYQDFVRIYVGPRIILFAQERESDDKDRVSNFEVYSLVFGASVGF